jgi:2-polyprenyl-3-methyl-5-hydroxy-6-metoxy-1,4-benzoquinol methylase
MAPRLDPEGVHLAALRRLADFRGRRVVEHGCGDGRLTVGIARDAAHVLAFDADPARIEKARSALPHELADRVTYRAGFERDLDLPLRSFDRHGGVLVVTLMSAPRGRR